jgi:hypothetical protein
VSGDSLYLSLPQGLDRERLEGWRYQLFDLGEGEEQGYHRRPQPRGQWSDGGGLTLRGREGESSVWYRTEFARPPWAERTLLRFDGAFTAANVWINGKLLGSHYGYPGPFGFDVSSFLEDRNVVAVCVQADRSHLPPAFLELQEDAGPWWPVGLVDRTWLERVGNVAVESLEASWEVSPGRAEARILTTVLNLDGREMEATVGWVLLPPEAPEAASEDAPSEALTLPSAPVTPISRWRRQVRLDGRQRVELETSVAVDRPELWWPWTLGSQHLYSLVAQVDCGGRSTTALRQIGVRQIDLTPAAGGLAWSVNGRRHFPRGAVLPPLPPGDESDPIGAWRLAGLDLALARGQIPSPRTAASADNAGVLLVIDPPPLARGGEAARDEHQREAINLIASHACAAVVVQRGSTASFQDLPAQSSPEEPYVLTPGERSEIEAARRAKYQPHNALVLTRLPDLEEAEGALAGTTALLDWTRLQDRQGLRLRFHVINDEVGMEGQATVRWRLRALDAGGFLPFIRDRSRNLQVRIPAPDQPPAIYEDEVNLPGRGAAAIEVGLERDGELLSYLEYEVEPEPEPA